VAPPLTESKLKCYRSVLATYVPIEKDISEAFDPAFPRRASRHGMRTVQISKIRFRLAGDAIAPWIRPPSFLPFLAVLLRRPRMGNEDLGLLLNVSYLNFGDSYRQLVSAKWGKQMQMRTDTFTRESLPGTR